MLNSLHRASAHLIDERKKFNTCRIKGTWIYEMFGQALQDVFFSLLLICLTLKYLSLNILIKKCLGFKYKHNCQSKKRKVLKIYIYGATLRLFLLIECQIVEVKIDNKLASLKRTHNFKFAGLHSIFNDVICNHF